MRLVVRESDGNNKERAVSAAVIRADRTGSIKLEVGPADGPPHAALTMSLDEAQRLSAALRAIGKNGGEEILLTEP